MLKNNDLVFCYENFDNLYALQKAWFDSMIKQCNIWINVTGKNATEKAYEETKNYYDKTDNVCIIRPIDEIISGLKNRSASSIIETETRIKDVRQKYFQFMEWVETGNKKIIVNSNKEGKSLLEQFNNIL